MKLFPHKCPLCGKRNTAMVPHPDNWCRCHDCVTEWHPARPWYVRFWHRLTSVEKMVLVAIIALSVSLAISTTVAVHATHKFLEQHPNLIKKVNDKIDKL